jgi:hypothetical protein
MSALTRSIVYNTSTAARLLGCSERWLKEQLRAGIFPGRIIARRWMLANEDLDEIVRLSAVAPKGDANV